MGTKKGAEQEKGGQDEAAQILVESHVWCQSFQLTGPSPQFLPEMVFTNGCPISKFGRTIPTLTVFFTDKAFKNY